MFTSNTSHPAAFSFLNCTTMIFNFLPINILFFLVLGTSTTFVHSFSNNVTDQQALLSFKSSITDDPSGVLDSWNNSIHFCHWAGVTCSRRRQRVTLLNVSSQGLAGTMSPHIGNLSFLRGIYLYENRFHGPIPNEIGRLFRLQYLSLGNNSFQGGFPADLHRCIDIRFIHLYNNHLEGELAIDFAAWSKLYMFALGYNHFTGAVPPSIWNISSIRSLYLDGNNFEGKLPTEFASWSKLDLIALNNNKLTGSIPPSIGNISSLRSLYLGGNNLRGSIPNEIGRLLRLQNLYLEDNSFQGVFPVNLSRCVDIRNINMSANDLEGELPTDFTYWSKLNSLDLEKNHFTGSIPPSTTNMSSLRILRLNGNYLTGVIPLEIAHLEELEFLNLSENRLSGTVPLPLYNVSSLYIVALDGNVLKGTLPSNLGFTLPKLQGFYAGGNNFSGPLPTSIVNASNLVDFDIAHNKITGPMPNNLGSLPNLEHLVLGRNLLGENMRPNDWSFFNSLINCTRLKRLTLYENSLRGELPKSVVNLSATMEDLYMEENYIYGSIPHGIGKLVNLRVVNFRHNLLTGSIPQSIGRLSKLGMLDLGGNNILGVIPTSISNITQLVGLYLDGNVLQGSIPTELFNISTLETVALSNNRLNGVISEQIVGLSSQCVFLYVGENLFTGPLPSNIGSLKQLALLSISNNKLTGDLPTTLSGCVMLEELYLGGNLFRGTIPSSFKALKSLEYLDLSNNNISGSIPSFFGGFPQIKFLNLAHNKLEGEVPKGGPFSNVSAFSIVGNLKLCGGIQALHLPDCPQKVSRKNKQAFALRNILIVLLLPLGMLSACLALFSYRRRNSKKLNDLGPVLKDDHYPKLSYQDLLLATNEFSPENLIGEGRYGSVYKGNVESVEHTLAVKVLNVEVRGANKSFLAECETLRNIRHRNLIKIITACSTTDFKGNEFKALVFEFMTNGSLDSWLHPSPSYQGGYERNLSLLQRLSISIDVALGVDYLHHHSHESIIHCDLKPNNILLDEDFVARIGDFGLARFCFAATTTEINQAQMSSTGVRGTVGYVPPEYGMGGEISAEGDVYSYGILLLEMFTGKRPTESSILMENNNNLHDFVRKALPQRVMDIVDPRIILDQEEHGMTVNQSYSRAAVEVCLTSIFEVGILCSEVMPRKRIDISVAIKQLHVARDKLLQRSQ